MGERITTLMGATGGAGEFTVVDYTNDLNTLFTKMDQLTNAVTYLDDTIEQCFGASSVPNSINFVAKATADNLKAINILLKDIDKKMVDQTGAGLQQISKHLSGVASSLNTGVATQFILTADQMKKNAFDKAATQAALKRNNLPEVTVSNADFITTLESVLQDAGNVAAQASATGFVTTQANRAITAATDWVTGLDLKPGEIFNRFKSAFVANSADKEGAVVQSEATVLKNLADTRYT